MTSLSVEFIHEIAKALEEEELDIYTLTLYSMNNDDLNYFSEEDRKMVKNIFNTLIQDTRSHADLLKLIVEMGVR